MKLNTIKQGPGYWKFNNSILGDHEYTFNIQNIIKETIGLCKNKLSNRPIWELLKINMKEYSVNFSVKRAKLLNTELKDLQNELDSLNNMITEYHIRGETTDNLECQRDFLQSKLVKHYKLKSGGIGV